MKRIMWYFHLWSTLTINSFLVSLSTRLSAFIFFIGKVLRFSFFLIFLFTIFGSTKVLAHYSVIQVVFFYLTFNLIDTVTQLFYREVYRFRPMIVSGDFDLVLVKPFSPLFRALAGGADPLDLIMLVPYIGAIVMVSFRLEGISMGSIVLYLLLLANAFLIATGFHILVLALAILTTEIDHAVMIYRDMMMMGRVPVDIYQEPIRSVITFIIPVGVMMTFPAKALFGLLSPWFIVFSFIFGVMFLLLCLRVWKYALTQYASASS